MNYKGLGYQLGKQATVVNPINLAHPPSPPNPWAGLSGPVTSLTPVPNTGRNVAPKRPPVPQPKYPRTMPAATYGPGRDTSSMWLGHTKSVPLMSKRVNYPTNSLWNPNAADWMSKWYGDTSRRDMKPGTAISKPLPLSARKYMNARSSKVMDQAKAMNPKFNTVTGTAASWDFDKQQMTVDPRSMANDWDDWTTTNLHEGIHAKTPSSLSKKMMEWRRWGKAKNEERDAAKERYDIVKAKSRSQPGSVTQAQLNKPYKNYADKFNVASKAQSQMHGISETETALGESIARARSKLDGGMPFNQVAAETAKIHKIPLYAAQNMIRHSPKVTDKDFPRQMHDMTLRPESQQFFLNANRDFPFGVHEQKEDPYKDMPTQVPTAMGRAAHMNPEAIKFMKEMNMEFGDDTLPAQKHKYDTAIEKQLRFLRGNTGLLPKVQSPSVPLSPAQPQIGTRLR